jgi:hypothetical protein
VLRGAPFGSFVRAFLFLLMAFCFCQGWHSPAGGPCCLGPSPNPFSLARPQARSHPAPCADPLHRLRPAEEVPAAELQPAVAARRPARRRGGAARAHAAAAGGGSVAAWAAGWSVARGPAAVPRGAAAAWGSSLWGTARGPAAAWGPSLWGTARGTAAAGAPQGPSAAARRLPAAASVRRGGGGQQPACWLLRSAAYPPPSTAAPRLAPLGWPAAVDSGCL